MELLEPGGAAKRPGWFGRSFARCRKHSGIVCSVVSMAACVLLGRAFVCTWICHVKHAQSPSLRLTVLLMCSRYRV